MKESRSVAAWGEEQLWGLSVRGNEGACLAVRKMFYVLIVIVVTKYVNLKTSTVKMSVYHYLSNCFSKVEFLKETTIQHLSGAHI